MTGKATSINCTSCGAGLDVLGGGRVLSHACGYCGAVLDSQDNYKILAKYEGLSRPESPLRLGDTGEIDGVQVTVIGTLGLRETWRGRVWTWAEHQVFSPTHGYGWLAVEDGHLTFTRKLRRLPQPDWYSSVSVERAESRPTIWAGETMKYYETSTAQIVFVEGEFNWVPKLHARTTTVRFMGEDRMISFAQSEKEREVETTRLLPPDTWGSFGHTAPTSYKVHPLQPYQASPHKPFLQAIWVIGLVASIILMFVLMGVSGNRETLGQYELGDIPQAIPFEVTDTTRPVKLILDTNLSNQWTWFEIEVTDPTGNTLFETGRQVSYYFGREDGENWSEGSRKASLGFQPTDPGTYTVTVAATEGATRNRDITITAQTGVTTITGAVFAMIAFVTLLLASTAGAMVHNKRRWMGSDWTEEGE